MAGNGVTTTTTSGMQAAADTMDRTRSEINNQMKVIEGHIDTLMASWQGDAARAFKQSCQPWFEDASRIAMALARQEAAIDSNRGNIVQSEANQVSDATGMAANVAINF